MTKKPEELYKIINYEFSQPNLLELALTHRSFSGNQNNERLEFLGDSILNYVIAEALFHKFPKAKEGQMSRLRASLVKGETLAVIGADWDLGSYLRLGSGELKSGGFRRESILADAVEAIIGAIILDSGHGVAKTKILEWYDSRIKALNLDQVTKDSKTRLQEFLQSRKKPLPDYEVVFVTGEPHAQTFRVKCEVAVLDAPEFGEGNSRRAAEQNAAANVLTLIESAKGKIK